jgi:hypothetical protein
MARTPRNRIGINVIDPNTALDYLKQFADMNIQAAGGYGKNVNNDGWVTQAGPMTVENQGHIKAMCWSVFVLALRADKNDNEAAAIISNICPIATAAANFKMNNELTASIEVKPEGETTKVANVHGSHAYQPHQG